LKTFKHIYFLKDFKHFIKTKYDFNKIGEDRLASLFFPKNKDFLTLQLGTLYTLDIVKNNLHLGGYLFPSIKTIKVGIENSTFIILPSQSRLLEKIYQTELYKKDIPRNTLDAILKSYLLSFFLFLKKILNKYPYPLYVSGGDYKFLKVHFKYFGIKFVYEPFIVLKGLKNFFYRFKIYKNI